MKPQVGNTWRAGNETRAVVTSQERRERGRHRGEAKEEIEPRPENLLC